MRRAVRDLITAAHPDRLPAYVYDLAVLREHVAAVRGALPDAVELYYAAKANPEPALLSALRPYVSGFEVSSGGELAHVREAVPGAPLAFGGPGKTPTEIEEAHARRAVTRFHVESAHELRLIAAAARRGERDADLLLRVNLPPEGGTLSGAPLTMGGAPSPFGLDPSGVDACLALLAAPGAERLRLRGVHAHLASGLDATEQAAVAHRVVEYATGLARRPGVRIEEINLGGGMAVDYADPGARFDWPALGAALARILDRHPGIRLRIEPGRALTAYCGWYATEVLDVKSSHGEDFAVLRGGTHHLRTPVTKGHDHPFDVLRVEGWPHPWRRPAPRGPLVTLVGQLCTPKDVLARRVPARGLRAGDRVAFAMAGAYAWNISHHDFLMHPRPRFHFVE